jgi:hypothetical protein
MGCRFDGTALVGLHADERGRLRSSIRSPAFSSARSSSAIRQFLDGDTIALRA